MRAQVIRANEASIQLELDPEAATVLSAILEFTAKLDDRCEALSIELQPLHDLSFARQTSG